MSKNEAFETVKDIEIKLSNLLTSTINLAGKYKHPSLIKAINNLLESHVEIAKLMIEMEKFDDK